MASITTRREDMFPVGTSVAVYTDRGHGSPTSGAPSGTAITGSPFTVAGDGTLTVTGLETAGKYLLYAASPDRYLRIFVPGPPTFKDMDLTGVEDGDAIGYDADTNKITSLGPVVIDTEGFADYEPYEVPSIPAAGGATFSRRRAPIADKAVHDLREFWSGEAVPADVVGALHDGLDRVAANGGRLFVPPPSVAGDILTVTEPICPDASASRKTAMFGVPFPFFESAQSDDANWSMIKLANGANCPIFRTDSDNSEGKRGPDRGNGGYWSWCHLDNIVFDLNGGNQTTAPTLRGVDIKDAWGVAGTLYIRNPQGFGVVFDNANACDVKVSGTGSRVYTTALAYLLNGSTDFHGLQLNLHAAKEAILRVEDCFGVEATNLLLGYSDGYGLELLGDTRLCSFRGRAEQSDKDNVFLDTTTHANTIDMRGFQAGHYGKDGGGDVGAGDGDWAHVRDHGSGNIVLGNYERRSPGASYARHLVNAGSTASNGLYLATGEDLGEVGDHVGDAYNGAASTVGNAKFKVHRNARKTTKIPGATPMVALGADRFALSQGSAVQGGADSAGRSVGWLLDPATQESVACWFTPESEVDRIWCEFGVNKPGTGTGNALFRLEVSRYDATEQITAVDSSTDTLVAVPSQNTGNRQAFAAYSTTLSADATAGDGTISVASATGMAVGGVLVLGTYPTVYEYTILEIVTTTITLDRPVETTVASGGTVAVPRVIDVVPGERYSVRVRRIADDVSDTYASDVAFTDLRVMQIAAGVAA